MLTRLDHIVLLTLDFTTAVSDYESLFGSSPDQIREGNTYQTAVFQTGNTALEIMAPIVNSSITRTRAILGEQTAALTTLAYCTNDIAAAHKTLTRRGARPGALIEAKTFRLDDDVCGGIKTFILLESGIRPPKPRNKLALDHLVVNTTNPDRAIAHYGARLDIRFALDRTHEEWGARFMFFKLADIVHEVIHRLGTHPTTKESDKLWGLTWKTPNLDIAHHRLSNAGVAVSDIRTGRKPGTRVFTVKSHSAGIPTLFLEQTE